MNNLPNENSFLNYGLLSNLYFIHFEILILLILKDTEVFQHFLNYLMPLSSCIFLAHCVYICGSLININSILHHTLYFVQRPQQKLII